MQKSWLQSIVPQATSNPCECDEQKHSSFICNTEVQDAVQSIAYFQIHEFKNEMAFRFSLTVLGEDSIATTMYAFEKGLFSSVHDSRIKTERFEKEAKNDLETRKCIAGQVCIPSLIIPRAEQLAITEIMWNDCNFPVIKYILFIL